MILTQAKKFFLMPLAFSQCGVFNVKRLSLTLSSISVFNVDEKEKRKALTNNSYL
jgi:hypothetical protein